MSTDTGENASTGTGTLTIKVSPTGKLVFKLEEGEKSIGVLLTSDEARNVGRDFFTAAARADLNAEQEAA